MKREAKTYKIHVFGTDYHIVSDEAEAHIVQAAALVDKTMQEIASGAVRADKQKVAVLAALQMASSLLYSQESTTQRKNKEDALVTRIEQVLASL